MNDVLMEVDPSQLVVHCAIVGLSTIGNIEWYKQWCNGGLKRMEDGRRNRRLLVASTFFLTVSAVMQMPFVDGWATVLYNLITLGNAMVKFGHTALVKLPNAMMERAFGIKPPDKPEEGNDGGS